VLKVFQVCFATGVLFSILSFIMGRISDFDHMGVDTDIDNDIDTDFSTDTDFDVDTDMSVEVEAVPELPVSPLKPIVITAFVTVFGGIGMICTIKGYSQAAAVVIALISGAAAAFLLYRFIIVPLYRAQNTSAISQKQLRGALAKVSLAINGNLFGKITYTVSGNSYSAPARSIDGEDIERGVPVVIISIEKNTCYVKQRKGGY
jgi:membrane protein implicated in regulation of membrane protease activity